MKMIRSILTAAACVLTVLVLSVAVSAAGSVQYTENAAVFVYTADGAENPQNLFADFQNVIPGDTLTQQILVKNDAQNKVKIKVYLRSWGAAEDSEELLSQMKLTVRQENDSVLYSGPADAAGSLAEWCYLGTVYSGGEIPLTVQLEIPVSLDSSFEEQIGTIDWEFRVEELPIEDSDPDMPVTGDASHLLQYVLLLVCSLLLLMLAVYWRRRRGC